ncbi:hypothetical protein B0H16DRAFT_148641 [Mycena metata]|uniref:RecQ-mediated genome instability protein 1 n=1 Tax=Mycena metata TaxID=1033252 RepID=A0AAD7JWU0_9AGAR|nr:hypothetical protein B0H16DRAFT_148641 [Mycena metata]
MPPPPELSAWLNEHYPSPRVDREWLDACYAWVTDEHQLNPAEHMPAIIEQVESQLLQSDLADSMSHGTGIPLHLLTAESGTLRGPVLVEIVALTEVGTSALALDQVRVARAERLAAGAGMGDEENEADLEVDGEGPVPNYPRGMLRFELHDGVSTLSAIEYRRLPELTLGVTPLGYKMVLKDVLVRRGIAFLEPACVTMKGFQTEDREAMQQADFARGLRHRLGRPEPPEAHAAAAAPPVAHAAAAQPAPPNPPPPQQIRSPLRDISPPPSPTLPVDSHHHSDDEDQPRRRRVPAPPPASIASSSSTLVTSAYFPSSENAGPPPRRGDMGLVLSPTRMGPIEIDSSSDEENGPSKRRIIGLRGAPKKKATPPPKEEPPSDDFGDDDMVVDDKFLEELAKAEAQYITPAPEAGPSAGPSSSRRKVDPDAEVITIDDDEEMEDKENVPAPQRHIRRRVAVFGERKRDEDVIDISSD